jgi:endonuclease III
VFQEITDLLVNEYGTPTLGNYKNPIAEIVYIVLSAKTSEKLYQASYRRLTASYPSIDALARAEASDIQSCISGAGFGRKRSVQIKNLAVRLVHSLGRNRQQALRKMSPAELFGFLTALPGVGEKSALCVMMYSFGLDVFPVDANVRRIAVRLGVLRKASRHYDGQRRLPTVLPDGRAMELHIALIMHGRTVCTPRRPRCNRCIIASYCKTGNTTLSEPKA